MKFEININREDAQAVMEQVNSMHNIALHNLGNSMVRNGNVERDQEIANATKIVYDIMSVITESLSARDRGENPDDYSFGEECCCEYISR
ncbi:hypothetical protein BSK59_13235 [Paenibacillus odorifer]|uniref:hypothetical protein n=1 Tax=Paenibacillus odorifer TaxID=189426 RepID=UPI00096E3714|nr:hypothetical protein [Paenibacillus odorifer]OME55435.1 hypothetical protein BSK59_13235 [Paenibacillus odorifer]